jgi:hypothetical protein
VVTLAEQIANKIPPHNLEAERAVLGGVLVEAGALVNVLTMLTPEDFYKTGHREIFEHMRQLHTEGEPVDLLTLKNALQRSGKLESVGGQAALAVLAEEAVSAINTLHYVGLVRKDATAREVISASTTVIDQAYNGDAPDVMRRALATTLDRLREDRDRTLPPPDLQDLGDELRFHWASREIEVVLAHPRDSGDGLRAEVALAVRGIDRHWGQLNLASGPSREQLVKKLRDTDGSQPWREILEHICRRGAEAFRAGEPVVCLMPKLRVEARRFLVPKLLVRDETNLIFADGGQGKSLLASALAVAVAAGPNIALPVIGKATEVHPVLYLDWESCIEEHRDRLKRLMDALEIEEAPPILYRAMTRPLADETAAIRTEIKRHHVGFVIVDSLGPASGAEPEGADAAVRAMNAMRSFRDTTRLVVAHMSKAAADQRMGATRPFGSVYVQNLARSVWEIRSTQDDESDLLQMGLYHRKVNGSRLLGSIGLRFTFAADRITLTPVDIAREPDLVARDSLPKRIIAALAGGAMIVDELAEHVGATPASVGAKLRHLKAKQRVLRLPDDEKGRGRWGLPA